MMKKSFLLLSLSLTVSLSASVGRIDALQKCVPAVAAQENPDEMTPDKQHLGLGIRVVTCNVRCLNPDDGENSWWNRREHLADALAGIGADVIGTQEAFYVQKEYLRHKLKGYNVVGVGRDDGKKEGEHSAIFYNKKRFKALDSGNFWLSETPDRPSKGWDAAYVRIATWALLQEKSTGKKFYFVNTHLDNVGVIARREGVTLLCRKAEQIGKDCPMVITGDFNSMKESEDIGYIKSLGLVHVYDIAGTRKLQPATWHNFTSDISRHVSKVIERRRKQGLKVEEPLIIDYIFISQGACSYYEIMNPKGPDGRFLSDHSPVFADIEL